MANPKELAIFYSSNAMVWARKWMLKSHRLATQREPLHYSQISSIT